LLCIDDDRDFSAALASRLRRYGIGVLNAFDGADGYRQAFLQPAAAIILDYNMPNGQGDYVLRRLQETPITKDIPVIVLTGNRDTTIRRTMLNLGASAFLFKPPQFEKLLEELARFVKLAPIDEPAPTP
ncbi:MAG: response regulator, partial [Planctomycetales bacterium]|nr:response regulator [Planctomycetales bacterium]